MLQAQLRDYYAAVRLSLLKLLHEVCELPEFIS